METELDKALKSLMNQSWNRDITKGERERLSKLVPDEIRKEVTDEINTLLERTKNITDNN